MNTNQRTTIGKHANTALKNSVQNKWVIINLLSRVPNHSNHPRFLRYIEHYLPISPRLMQSKIVLTVMVLAINIQIRLTTGEYVNIVQEN